MNDFGYSGKRPRVKSAQMRMRRIDFDQAELLRYAGKPRPSHHKAKADSKNTHINSQASILLVLFANHRLCLSIIVP
jgi:hypothetical protein